VALDASYAARGPSGTGVYIERLAEELEALGVEVRRIAARPHRYLSARDLAWTHATLPRRASGADVLHHPLPAISARARMPQVVTVHDLAFLRVPDCFNHRFRTVAAIRHRAAARAAAAVIVPSEATKADVRSRWAVPDERIVVAPHGPGQVIPSDRGEPRHFLYVGDDEPRKNLARLREAHALAGTGLPLVVAGRAGEPVDRERLADLHRHAAALVIPSLYEGFGLPALEALHAGTPVLAGRTAGLTEVCGDAARYCDPRDADDIARGLRELAMVGPLREELRRRGLRRAEAFSWRRCAEAHLAAYTLALR
jgi:glycosyltransferase involved in cell wall biosynthesis